MKLFAVALVCAALFAQAPRPAAPPPDDPTRITLDVTRINLLFTVSDKRGRFVTDLTKDDFEIYESKKPQSIVEFTAETDLPLAPGDPDGHQQQYPRAFQVPAGRRPPSSSRLWFARVRIRPPWSAST
jgi:hypothetical protein